ncbi:MAG: hypothetical protein U9O94_10235, partial [Nanoarchaeota archaeon]|nr:hypothetical protein [Nanoarchaeota archaeon]
YFLSFYENRKSILEQAEETDNNSYDKLADKMLARFVKDMLEGCESNAEFRSNCMRDYVESALVYHESTHAGSGNLAHEELVKEETIAYLLPLSLAPSYYLIKIMFDQVSSCSETVNGVACNLIFSEYEKKGFDVNRFLTAGKEEISKIAGELLGKYIEVL